jgi:subtilase family serine protease
MKKGNRKMKNFPKAGFAVLLGVSIGFAIPATAQQDSLSVSYTEGMRPPKGYARPPFHIKPGVSTATPIGLAPAAVRHAYGFDEISNQGEGMVIAIIDAYDHPNIESDLGVFSSTFGLPSCTTPNGCFRKIYASGSKPRTDAGWAIEMSLDVEWAHAIAPKAKILLVEAATSRFNDLMNAVDVAMQNGASTVSMSFGASEFSSETTYDSHFNNNNHPGVTFLASSGDSGYGSEFPSASTYVVGVGGTTLNIDPYGNYIGETAWSGSGGGLSSYETEPAGQAAWPLPYAGKRGIPDVAYNGDPNTGFAVYDSVSYLRQSGWFKVGGTSAGAPQWAGLFAIANSMRVAAGKLKLSATYNTLYNIGKTAYGNAYNDVTTGSNGSCGAVCNASGGYDYVTGLGSPRAAGLVQNLLSQP